MKALLVTIFTAFSPAASFASVQNSERAAYELGQLTGQLLGALVLAFIGWWAYLLIRPRNTLQPRPAQARATHVPASFPDRAGNVLYGIGLVGAVLTAAAAVLIAFAPTGDRFALFLLPAAAVPYAVGWTLRYLCSGKLGF